MMEVLKRDAASQAPQLFRRRDKTWPAKGAAAGTTLWAGRNYIAVIALLAAALLVGGAANVPVAPMSPPLSLRETGLYSDAGALEVDARHLAFAPQYPLWTDGAAKRRWISLPPGTAIDGKDPDAWVFPVGTRLWKEFAFEGRRVETRYLQRISDGEWLYATYEWDED